MPTGSCLCNKLQYEYEGEPLAKARKPIILSMKAFSLIHFDLQATCHCLSCRKISGGTHSLNLIFPENKIRVVSGSAKSLTLTHETGKNLTITFCGNCGCAVYKTHELFPGSIIILAGTLDDPEGLEKSKPEQELFTKHRVSWLSKFEWANQKSEF